MKFSIEEILKKDSTPKCSMNVAFPTLPRFESYSNISMDNRSQAQSNDLSSTESALSDYSDDVFIDSASELRSRKRVRTVITRRHKAKLELIFRASPYQSLTDLLKIGREFGLPQHVVKIWFQNRRAKFRKQGYKNPEEPRYHPSRPHSSLSCSSSDSYYPYEQSKPSVELDEIYSSRASHQCGLSCCHLPQQRSENRSSLSCNCTECSEQERSLARVHIANEERRLIELFNKRSKSVNASFCRKSPFCCCLQCRLGTVYVKY